MMQKYAYSPDTGEMIATDTPQAWMKTTAIAPPAFDRSKEGCFWKDVAWVIVVATPEPAPIPTVVFMRQARLALLGAGLLTQVNAAISAMPGAEGEAARIEWEYATEVRRDAALVAGLSAALALTGEQLDALFVAAAAL